MELLSACNSSTFIQLLLIVDSTFVDCGFVRGGEDAYLLETCFLKACVLYKQTLFIRTKVTLTSKRIYSSFGKGYDFHTHDHAWS